ncbi:MAG: dehypoxanthine futalosine cyclase [Acidobacteriota bacterium]|nr:dehypoxanthine futalosine cyclase [Acidobacteriota bacterium]
MQAINEIAAKVRQGGRVDRHEALALYSHAPTALLGELADVIRERKHPGRSVTYIIDRNVNYTNVCVARCNFCAFYRPVGSQDGYVLGFEEIYRKIDETIALGGGQLLLQGGHNPDLPLAWYEDLFRGVKSRYPEFKLHALSPPEVIHLTRMSRLSIAQVIERLVNVGLDSIPGGGAEILVDRVRKILNCYNKATADEWLDVMRHAHRAGLRTTATMMYGHVETPEERLEHMLRLRELQDESRGLPAVASAKAGFTAFITWSYQPEHTELGGFEATGVEYLRTLAIGRIVLDNFDNMQASWVTQGGKVGQLSLAYGANDMGSVMIEENVVRAAGAAFCMDEIEIVRNIENAGFTAKRRNMHYDVLGEPIFRQREVPRMLELAVARHDGDTSRPAELSNYATRSAAEKRLRRSELSE